MSEIEEKKKLLETLIRKAFGSGLVNTTFHLSRDVLHKTACCQNEESIKELSNGKLANQILSL